MSDGMRDVLLGLTAFLWMLALMLLIVSRPDASYLIVIPVMIWPVPAWLIGLGVVQSLRGLGPEERMKRRISRAERDVRLVELRKRAESAEATYRQTMEAYLSGEVP